MEDRQVEYANRNRKIFLISDTYGNLETRVMHAYNSSSPLYNKSKDELTVSILIYRAMFCRFIPFVMADYIWNALPDDREQ